MSVRQEVPKVRVELRYATVRDHCAGESEQMEVKLIDRKCSHVYWTSLGKLILHTWAELPSEEVELLSPASLIGNYIKGQLIKSWEI